MVEYAEGLIVGWAGWCKGTKHMIQLAHRRGLKVRVYHRVDQGNEMVGAGETLHGFSAGWA